VLFTTDLNYEGVFRGAEMFQKVTSRAG
jgi:hypothetical protein